jgi:hypothetical protein
LIFIVNNFCKNACNVPNIKVIQEMGPFNTSYPKSIDELLEDIRDTLASELRIHRYDSVAELDETGSHGKVFVIDGKGVKKFQIGVFEVKEEQVEDCEEDD